MVLKTILALLIPTVFVEAQANNQVSPYFHAWQLDVALRNHNHPRHPLLPALLQQVFALQHNGLALLHTTKAYDPTHQEHPNQGYEKHHRQEKSKTQ